MYDSSSCSLSSVVNNMILIFASLKHVQYIIVLTAISKIINNVQ